MMQAESIKELSKFGKSVRIPGASGFMFSFVDIG